MGLFELEEAAEHFVAYGEMPTQYRVSFRHADSKTETSGNSNSNRASDSDSGSGRPSSPSRATANANAPQNPSSNANNNANANGSKNKNRGGNVQDAWADIRDAQNNMAEIDALVSESDTRSIQGQFANIQSQSQSQSRDRSKVPTGSKGSSSGGSAPPMDQLPAAGYEDYDDFQPPQAQAGQGQGQYNFARDVQEYDDEDEDDEGVDTERGGNHEFQDADGLYYHDVNDNHSNSGDSNFNSPSDPKAHPRSGGIYGLLLGKKGSGSGSRTSVGGQSGARRVPGKLPDEKGYRGGAKSAFGRSNNSAGSGLKESKGKNIQIQKDKGSKRSSSSVGGGGGGGAIEVGDMSLSEYDPDMSLDIGGGNHVNMMGSVRDSRDSNSGMTDQERRMAEMSIPKAERQRLKKEREDRDKTARAAALKEKEKEDAATAARGDSTEEEGDKRDKRDKNTTKLSLSAVPHSTVEGEGGDGENEGSFLKPTQTHSPPTSPSSSSKDRMNRSIEKVNEELSSSGKKPLKIDALVNVRKSLAGLKIKANRRRSVGGERQAESEPKDTGSGDGERDREREGEGEHNSFENEDLESASTITPSAPVLPYEPSLPSSFDKISGPSARSAEIADINNNNNNNNNNNIGHQNQNQTQTVAERQQQNNANLVKASPSSPAPTPTPAAPTTVSIAVGCTRSQGCTCPDCAAFAAPVSSVRMSGFNPSQAISSRPAPNDNANNTNNTNNSDNSKIGVPVDLDTLPTSPTSASATSRSTELSINIKQQVSANVSAGAKTKSGSGGSDVYDIYDSPEQEHGQGQETPLGRAFPGNSGNSGSTGSTGSTGGNNSGSSGTDAFSELNEYATEEVQLCACADCGRKFSPEVLARHASLCKKQLKTKKRKPLNMTEQVGQSKTKF